jgi:hypothetical protein
MDSIVLKYGAETVVHACDANWDESGTANITASLDTADKKVGTGSVKLTATAEVAAGEILKTDNIASADLSTYLGIRFWIKPVRGTGSTNYAAGAFQLLLDDTASCASPLETIDLPALTNGVWSLVFLPFSNPSLLTAVISVGLKGVLAVTIDTTINIDALTAVTAKEYSTLGVRGFDDVDSLRFFPRLQSELLDGAMSEEENFFGRNVTVDLGVISTKADRVWLVLYLMSATKKLLCQYPGEELSVVFGTPEGMENEWLEGLEFARSFTLEFKEVAVNSTAPAAWA